MDYSAYLEGLFKGTFLVGVSGWLFSERVRASARGCSQPPNKLPLSAVIDKSQRWLSAAQVVKVAIVGLFWKLKSGLSCDANKRPWWMMSVVRSFVPKFPSSFQNEPPRKTATFRQVYSRETSLILVRFFYCVNLLYLILALFVSLHHIAS